MRYTASRVDKECRGYKYIGYIDTDYAGCIIGHAQSEDVFDIRQSELEPRFRGTKAVRAFSEIIKAIHVDFKYIVSRIDNKDNAEIKIVLSAGFHIIGTMSMGDEVSVELLKIREDN